MNDCCLCGDGRGLSERCPCCGAGPDKPNLEVRELDAANDEFYRFVGMSVGVAVGPKDSGYEVRFNLPNRKVRIWRATKLDAIRSARAYIAKCANSQGN